MSEHELWNELGNVYFLAGVYAQAVHAYHRAIKLDDRFGRPYSNLALTYVQQGKFEQAVDLYRRSIELLTENKEKAISWNRLGNVYRYLRDYQDAVSAYRQADQLDPENGNDDDKPGWLSEPARGGYSGRDDSDAERGFNSPGAHAPGDESGPRCSAQARKSPRGPEHHYLDGCESVPVRAERCQGAGPRDIDHVGRSQPG